MNTECPECQPFIDETERLYSPTLREYSFTFVECHGERDGRECRVMYEGTLGRLLFIMEDRVLSCMLGKCNTPFPPFVLLGDKGDYGWYHIVMLAEVEADKELISQHLMNSFRTGRLYDYEWEANLLAERIEQLFAFLESHSQESLRKMMEGRLRKNEGRW